MSLIIIFLSLQKLVNAHPTLVNTGQLALMLLITTLVCALPGLEGRTARRVSNAVGESVVLPTKAVEV